MSEAAREGGFPNGGGPRKLPTYEYRCSQGHQYERIEGFDAPSEQTCPTCGSRSLRQISLPAVIFKGPGFYSTDNRRGFASGNGGHSSFSSDGGSEKSESKSKSDGGSKASDSESKTEAKAD